jgi:hypothetical protein
MASVMHVDNHAAYMMRVDDRSRVTYAAATSAAQKFFVVTPPALGLTRCDLYMALKNASAFYPIWL